MDDREIADGIILSVSAGFWIWFVAYHVAAWVLS
jgi:hypothetical protein